MIVAGLDLHWQGVAAILVGSVALGLGVRHVRTSGATPPAVTNRPPNLLFTAEDFPRPSHLPAAPGDFFRHLPNQIDAEPGGACFVVGYGDYLSCILVTDDPWRLPRGRQLALALQASPGADAADPKEVGHESVSGLMEDYFVRYECRLRVSPANVLALRSTRFTWTDAAEALAESVAPQTGAVAAVQQMMAELARRDVEANDRRFRPHR